MCGSRKHHRWRNKNEIEASRPGVDGKQLLAGHRQDQGPVRCLHCGYKLAQFTSSSYTRYCPNCGEKLLHCPISKNTFRDGEEFAQCPSCHTIFHHLHLVDWLSNNRICPVCREEMREILRGVVGRNRVILS